MNLLEYAPRAFKDHIARLDTQARFREARICHELGFNNKMQHYVLTGNDGVGIEDAIRLLFDRWEGRSESSDYSHLHADRMFDVNTGFESTVSEACQDNRFVHIANADRLSMRGNTCTQSGFEILCDHIPGMKGSVIVLTGDRLQMQELINSNEKAREWFPHIFHFEDLTPEAMMEYMLDYANSQNYQFDPAAETMLGEYLGYTYKQRGSHFRNSCYLESLFDHQIVPRMAARIVDAQKDSGAADLCTIQPEDLPDIKSTDSEAAIRKLESLVGLDSIKKQILDHTSLVKLNSLRAGKGLYNRMPPMHMVFTGNPGTGKTTIAKYLGEIYHSIGVLSSGHVVETERTKLVGEYIGVTEKNTLNAIKSASGGVLFIDEAYNLFTDSDNRRDYGMRVIETLLTYLSSEDTDLIVILAGYTGEMERMLESNPGMKSRFPYIFQFDDYTPDQLMQIGKKVLEQEHYTMTPEAERKLAKYVIHAYDHKDNHFGNGRFITRLITTHIIPSLSRRLLSRPAEEITLEEMSTILDRDVPEVVTQEQRPNDLDETILTESLDRLDQLVGLGNVKQALHDYVSISRLRHRQGTLKVTPRSLTWNFIGKTGTGKSTVAEILGKVMQGLGVLKRGQTVTVRAEELTGNDCYQVIERALREAADGLLFLDMDDPSAANLNTRHLYLWITNKLRELHQTTALVIAKVKTSEDQIARNLTANGITTYGNSIAFQDFTSAELADILGYLLRHDYHLDVTPEAQQLILRYVESAHRNESKDSPVNARTIVHLAQTIANITLLRTVSDGGERTVTPQDVAQFKWSGKSRGTVGYV